MRNECPFPASVDVENRLKGMREHGYLYLTQFMNMTQMIQTTIFGRAESFKCFCITKYTIEFRFTPTGLLSWGWWCILGPLALPFFNAVHSVGPSLVILIFHVQVPSCSHWPTWSCQQKLGKQKLGKQTVKIIRRGTIILTEKENDVYSMSFKWAPKGRTPQRQSKRVVTLEHHESPPSTPVA